MASRVISCSPWQCLSHPSDPPGDFPSVDLHHCLRYRKSRSAVASLSRCRDEGLLCFSSPLPSTNPPPASTIFLGPDEGRGLAESPSWQGNSRGQGRGQSAGCWVLGDGAEVCLPLFLAVSPLSFSWGILHTSLPHLRSPRPQQTPQKCLLATCHACSRHKLCANLPWETPFGERDAWAVHRVASGGRRVLGLSFLMDTYTALARYRHIPPPSQLPKR